MSFTMAKMARKTCSCILLLVMMTAILFGNIPFTSTVHAAAESANLLKNPGFEEGATLPSYWVPMAGFENLMQLDTTEKYEGERSLKLYVSAATKRSIYDQRVPVVEGRIYSLSVFNKLNAYTGSALVYLYYYGADGKARGTAQYVSLGTGSTAWKENRLDNVVIPAGAVQVMVRLMLIGKDGNGCVWLDNLKFIENIQNLGSVTLASSKSQLYMGQTIKPVLTGKYESGVSANIDEATIEYSSDAPEIASVASDGTITALAAGIASITASVTLAGINKETQLSVTVLPDTLEEVRLTTEKTSLYEGQTLNFVTAGILSNGAAVDPKEVTVTYTSSDATIGQITNTGVFTAVKEGTVTITSEVTLGNMKKSASINITVIKAVLGKVQIVTDRSELLLNETIENKILGVMTDGRVITFTNENSLIKLSSSNEAVAKVVQNGAISALALGEAVIEAEVTYEGVTVKGTLKVSVVDRINAETLSYSFKNLGLLDTYKNPPVNQPTQEGWSVIDATTRYSAQPFGITLQAESLNNLINLSFTVPETGLYKVKFIGTRSRSGGMGSIIVDGTRVGDFNFSADAQTDNVLSEYSYIKLDQGNHVLTLKSIAKGTSGSQWYYLYPTEFILEKIQDVRLTADKTGLLLGQTAKLSLVALINDVLADVSNAGITAYYTSGNTAVATVTANGTVTPVSAGNVTLTAAAAMGGLNITKSISMNVSSATFAAVNIQVPQTNGRLPVDSQAQTSITALDSDGKALDITTDTKTYKSSNTAVLIINNNGVISALSLGTATVSVDVTIGGVTKTGFVDITVVPADLQSVSLSAFQTTIPLGRTSQLRVAAIANNGKPAALDLAKIFYTTSDSAVATVSSEGVATGVSVGSATITVSVTLMDITREATLTLDVQDPNSIQNSKTRSTYYTESKVAAARYNVDNFSWAEALKNNTLLAADKYLNLGDEFLWSMVTPQSVPRTMYHMQRTKITAVGCPVCGTELNTYGSYPWKMDPINDPWKLTCPNPSCNTRFPTNDYEAYYKSGLDEHGIFNKALANSSLLVNTLYPEKGEKWGVDDGSGWVDSKGNVFTFVSFYNHWALWYGQQGQNGIIQKALKAFRDAYVYTGDVKYAHAGIILLDRIADVYPDMDITDYLWAQGYDNGQPDYHTCQGKVLNDIWETFLATDFASAYDAFFPALMNGDTANVLPFLSSKGDQYGLGILKYSTEGIMKNIEDNILRQVFPAVKNSQIRGNQGMHQATLAMAAVVLDEEGTTKEMLDFNFQPGALQRVSGSQYPNGRQFIVTGGNILGVLTNDVDRDGFGNESSPDYNKLWIDQMTIVADVLDGYDRYPEADMYKNPEVGAKFIKMFKAQYPLIMLGKYVPSIGDSGGTGLAGVSLSIDLMVKAYEKFQDPEFAQIAYMLNKNSTVGIHSSVFTENPGQVAVAIKDIIDTLGTLNPPSENLTGYGLTALRDGKDYSKTVGYEYNFLQMSVTDSTGKEIKQVAGPSLFYRSAGAGDYISFGFTAPETTEYEISLRTMLANLYGQYIIKIDGQQVGGIYDGYAPQTKESDLTKIGDMVISAGEHEITLECVGKNEVSTNYVIGLMKLVLLDKKAAEELADSTEPKDNTQRDVWVYYGRNTGHGHKDTLNLGVHAFGLDVAPDLGYPEITGTDPKRLQWTNNTVSHNTVVVDKSKQKDSWVGTPLHFDETDWVSFTDISAPLVYPQTSMYRRTTAMIKVDDINSYAVDLFRIEGGNEHHFSFHSNASDNITTEGLNLVTQETGTYAGSDVPFKQLPAGETSGNDYLGAGFHYLRNVQRDNDPADLFSVDWQQKNDPGVHLRLTMLGEINDAALAVGEPPLNGSNPRELTYLMAHRTGSSLKSTFTSVIEPYKGDRYIESISLVSLKVNGQPVQNDEFTRAIKVVLKNGRTDYIISSLNADVTYTIDDKFEFRGFFGVYSEMNGQPVYNYINDGTAIGLINSSEAEYTGTIIDFTPIMDVKNEIIVDFNKDINIQNLAGRFIYVENDGKRNAAYRIEGAKSLAGGKVALDIGDMTLIRSWADPQDYSKGYVYDINEGQKFRIPLSVVMQDSMAPGTELITDKKANSNGWFSENVTVTLVAADDMSKPKETLYRINGGEWITYTAPFDISIEGENVIEYRSIDYSGKLEDIKSLTIMLDKTSPDLTVILDKEFIRNVNHKMVDITASVEYSDVVSGIQSVELYSITSSQSDNDLGDGNTYEDIQDADFGTLDTEFAVRAERGATEKAGRVYTVIYKVVDNAGNESFVTRKITVYPNQAE